LLRQWLESSEPLQASTIVWTEFLCGPLSDMETSLARDLLQEVIPLSAQHAALAARLFDSSGRRRGSLADCMIAAVAIQSDAQLATSNPRDFVRLEPYGLILAGRL